MYWQNLLPSCALCNSTYKRDPWSDDLLCPEQADIESFFDFDPETGEMRAAPELDATGRRRAEGPYRFVAERLLQAKLAEDSLEPTVTASPESDPKT